MHTQEYQKHHRPSAPPLTRRSIKHVASRRQQLEHRRPNSTDQQFLVNRQTKGNAPVYSSIMMEAAAAVKTTAMLLVRPEAAPSLEALSASWVVLHTPGISASRLCRT